jgi:hypothetical protein
LAKDDNSGVPGLVVLKLFISIGRASFEGGGMGDRKIASMLGAAGGVG